MQSNNYIISGEKKKYNPFIFTPFEVIVNSNFLGEQIFERCCNLERDMV